MAAVLYGSTPLAKGEVAAIVQILQHPYLYADTALHSVQMLQAALTGLQTPAFMLIAHQLPTAAVIWVLQGWQATSIAPSWKLDKARAYCCAPAAAACGLQVGVQSLRVPYVVDLQHCLRIPGTTPNPRTMCKPVECYAGVVPVWGLAQRAPPVHSCMDMLDTPGPCSVQHTASQTSKRNANDAPSVPTHVIAPHLVLRHASAHQREFAWLGSIQVLPEGLGSDTRPHNPAFKFSRYLCTAHHC